MVLLPCGTGSDRGATLRNIRLSPFHVSAIVATRQRSLRPSSTAIWRRIESEERSKVRWSGRRESNPRVQLGKGQFDVENIEIFAFLATFWHQGSHVELCENKLFRHSHVSTAC